MKLSFLLQYIFFLCFALESFCCYVFKLTVLLSPVSNWYYSHHENFILGIAYFTRKIFLWFISMKFMSPLINFVFFFTSLGIWSKFIIGLAPLTTNYLKFVIYGSVVNQLFLLVKDHSFFLLHMSNNIYFLMDILNFMFLSTVYFHIPLSVLDLF